MRGIRHRSSAPREAALDIAADHMTLVLEGKSELPLLRSPNLTPPKPPTWCVSLDCNLQTRLIQRSLGFLYRRPESVETKPSKVRRIVESEDVGSFNGLPRASKPEYWDERYGRSTQAMGEAQLGTYSEKFRIMLKLITPPGRQGVNGDKT